MSRDERFERMANFVLQWEIERDSYGNMIAEQDPDYITADANFMFNKNVRLTLKLGVHAPQT
jgi:hypothetical protein